MKRGVLGEPFVFIFAMIVVAMLLFFGFKFTGELKDRGEFLILSDSIIDLKNQVARYYSFDPGATKTVRLDLPNQVDEICFTNSERAMGEHPFSRIFKGTSNYNVFVLPFDAFKITRFNIPNLEPNVNPLCLKNIGKVEVLLVNKGDFVEISGK